MDAQALSECQYSGERIQKPTDQSTKSTRLGVGDHNQLFGERQDAKVSEHSIDAEDVAAPAKACDLPNANRRQQ